MQPGIFQITLKVVLRQGPNMLVLRDRRQQVGDLPGGRLSAGEIFKPWTNSVHRELEEELGRSLVYKLEPEPLFWFPHFVVESQSEALGFVYLAELAAGEIELSEEHDWYDWVPILSYDPSRLYTEHLLAAVQRFQREVQRWIPDLR